MKKTIINALKALPEDYYFLESQLRKLPNRDVYRVYLRSHNGSEAFRHIWLRLQPDPTIKLKELLNPIGLGLASVIGGCASFSLEMDVYIKKV